MIHSKDRSGWFGASDTYTIMGNWKTETFKKFWLVKLGALRSNFSNVYMMAGTNYEHRILDAIGIKKRDRQIKIHRYRLRVNLDGEDKTTVYEVKTYKDEFKISRSYWMQAQVEMFITGKKLTIVSYKLNHDDYDNFFNEIDPARIQFHLIEYDPEFIRSYLKKLKYLKKCLRKKEFP